MKKYKLLKKEKNGLHRIKALKDFSNIKSGELGGYVMSEDNLSHGGDAWVSEDAIVSGDARVSGDAIVYGDARVYGDATVSGNARVFGGMKTDGFIKWFSRVGSGNGTLTITKHKDTGIMVSRGCFVGTLAEFEKAVKKKPKDCPHRKEYLGLIKVMKNY